MEFSRGGCDACVSMHVLMGRGQPGDRALLRTASSSFPACRFGACSVLTLYIAYFNTPMSLGSSVSSFSVYQGPACTVGMVQAPWYFSLVALFALESHEEIVPTATDRRC
jgi:hypothetical protein